MGEILVAEHDTFDGSPGDLFAALEHGQVPGWEIPSGVPLAHGVPLRMSIALPPGLGGRRVDVLGRVSRLIPGRVLVVEHHVPWRGTVSLSVEPSGARRSRVRMVVKLDDSSIEWLEQARGAHAHDDPDVPHDAYRLGLLMSGSGPLGVIMAATGHVAAMAVDEINADGGIAGKPLVLDLGDDGSDPTQGAIELGRLARRGCRAVIANVSSATIARIEPVARRLGVELIYTPLNEGGAHGASLLRLGERPAAQLRQSVPQLMRLTGETRWFLAGNNYCWPRVTNQVARRVIERHAGTVVGERYERLGSQEFGPLIAAIEKSGAELVVSTFVGADEVRFEQQFHSAGLRGRFQTLSLALDETTMAHIGPDAREGLWTSQGYFEELQTPENGSFLERYRARYGTAAPLVSSFSESVYDAVHLYARAAVSVERDQAPSMLRALRGMTFDGPRGRVQVGPDGLEQAMFLAKGTVSGLQVMPT